MAADHSGERPADDAKSAMVVGAGGVAFVRIE